MARPETPLIRIGIYSLSVNIGLAGAKFALSLLSGSLALRADAIHSLVDVFGSLALILGLAISGRKSKSFPYGLYKVENVVSVVIALLLFLAAYEIVRDAIVGQTVAETYGEWLLAVVAALVLVPFFFGRYEVNMGRKVNSPSLVADGSQFKADVLSSLVVLLALVAQRFGFPLDRIAAGIVAVFIVRAGWSLLLGSMRVLLDASVDQATLQRIRSIIETDPAVVGVDTLAGRNSGRYVFVDAVVTLRTTDLVQAHRSSERLERKIRQTVPNVDRVLIHYEPPHRDTLRYAVALDDRGGHVSQHFGESPFFALVDTAFDGGRLLSQRTVANPHAKLSKQRGIKVAEFLLTYKPDVVVAGEELVGKGPGYVFDDAGVETVRTESGSLDQVIAGLGRSPTRDEAEEPPDVGHSDRKTANDSAAGT